MQFRSGERRDTTRLQANHGLATPLEREPPMFRSITHRLEDAISALATAFLIGPLVVASAMFLATSL